MLWRGRRQSDNIEDDRSSGGLGGGGQFRVPIGGGVGGGRMSLSSIVILGVIALIAWGVFGINPLQLLNGEGGSLLPGGNSEISDNSGGQASGSGAPANDETKQFVATVLAETEDTWS